MTVHLRRGDRSTAVADLRRRLATWQRLTGPSSAPDGPVPADGGAGGDVFDDELEDVVRRFQRARHLPTDAVVGPETWRALIEATWALGDRLLWHATTVMRGDDVEDLQRRLNGLGFDAGPEDGMFGATTRAAVEEFQQDAGLEVDGMVGARTIAMLQVLHRGHHAHGVGARVREEHGLRRVARGGLTGRQVAIDAAPLDPRRAPDAGTAVGHVTWQLATRLAGVLSARGARPLFTRGPQRTEDGSTRAATANRMGADLVVVLALNADPAPEAGGAAAYYYGSFRFVSATGRSLADALLDAALAAGFGPDCRTHPMTWTMLRETRMPAVVLEPGFATNAGDVARLLDPAAQDRLARSLAAGLQAFLEGYAG